MDKIKNITGVKIFKIQKINNLKGNLYKLIQIDKDNFSKFGESYISEIGTKKIKAWKRHLSQTQNIIIINGKVEIVLFDGRENSKTFNKIDIFKIGPKSKYSKIQIPPLIWYGFKGLDKKKSTMINFTDKTHYSTRHENLPIKNKLINYNWNK